MELNIGDLAKLPHEIRNLIFQRLTFADVSASASVSKSWFNITSSTDLWAPLAKTNIGDLDPFTSFQHEVINKSIWKNKSHYVYATDLDVTNGKGLLVCEEGYLQGLKLNGTVRSRTISSFVIVLLIIIIYSLSYLHGMD